MMNDYVAIDIETTGLDPSRDAIIEVAAITFRGNDILDEYSTLVYPQRDIPVEITRLTGISQAMVEDAPGMYQVRSQLRPILSNHILVGHNVDFDLSFLQEERLAVGNPRIDTVTLASILVPEAGRFGLNALADFLYLPLPEGGQAHRAKAKRRWFPVQCSERSILHGSLPRLGPRSGQSVPTNWHCSMPELVRQTLKLVYSFRSMPAPRSAGSAR